MAPILRPFPLPLRVDKDGDIRVGQSHVLLDMVVHLFQRGDSPERIVQAFDSLELSDVYAAIAYYLRNRDELDAYLRSRQAAGEELRREIEGRPGSGGFKEKLLARIGKAS